MYMAEQGYRIVVLGKFNDTFHFDFQCITNVVLTKYFMKKNKQIELAGVEEHCISTCAGISTSRKLLCVQIRLNFFNLIKIIVCKSKLLQLNKI